MFFIENKGRIACEMAQWVRAFATKSINLSLMPRLHIMEEQTPHRLTSDLYTHTTLSPTCNNNKVLKGDTLGRSHIPGEPGFCLSLAYPCIHAQTSSFT